MNIKLAKMGNGIKITELKENQVAIITEWACSGYVGTLVVRKGDELISIERLLTGGGHNWTPCPTSDGCYVRLLRPGSLITIEI